MKGKEEALEKRPPPMNRTATTALPNSGPMLMDSNRHPSHCCREKQRRFTAHLVDDAVALLPILWSHLYVGPTSAARVVRVTRGGEIIFFTPLQTARPAHVAATHPIRESDTTQQQQAALGERRDI